MLFLSFYVFAFLYTISNAGNRCNTIQVFSILDPQPEICRASCIFSHYNVYLFLVSTGFMGAKRRGKENILDRL